MPTLATKSDENYDGNTGEKESRDADLERNGAATPAVADEDVVQRLAEVGGGLVRHGSGRRRNVHVIDDVLAGRHRLLEARRHQVLVGLAVRVGQRLAHLHRPSSRSKSRSKSRSRSRFKSPSRPSFRSRSKSKFGSRCRFRDPR